MNRSIVAANLSPAHLRVSGLTRLDHITHWSNSAVSGYVFICNTCCCLTHRREENVKQNSVPLVCALVFENTWSLDKVFLVWRFFIWVFILVVLKTDNRVSPDASMLQLNLFIYFNNHGTVSEFLYDHNVWLETVFPEQLRQWQTVTHQVSEGFSFLLLSDFTAKHL